MTLSHRFSRTMLFGFLVGASACDVVAFVSDPMPRFVETWNIPASATSISVASLLPAGVTIYNTPASNPPDSSGFQVSLNNIAFTSLGLGTYCAPCQALNGTNANKPAFNLSVAGSSGLPTNVVSAAIVNDTLVYSITNSFSFDPIHVNTVTANPQGFMIILVRSGSLVLARDSVNGATTLFPPAPAAGSVLTRTVPLSSGNVTANISVDLSVTSPAGDHSVPINANGTLATSAGIAILRVANVRINVPNTPITNSAPTDLPDGLDPSITEHVIKGILEMTITNPFAITGNLDARFVYGVLPSEVVIKQIALPTGPAQVRSVSLDSTEMVHIFSGTPTTLTVTGGVTSAAPVLVTPKQKVSISNRLILTIRTGGGN